VSVSHVQDSCSPVAGGLGASWDVGVAAVGRLVEMLSRVPDPRKPRGVRHRVGSVLAVTVFAALAGASNFRKAGDRAADLPQELLALAGWLSASADRALRRAQRGDDSSGGARYRRRRRR
jgi:DDE_Tnp_1-associated